MQISVLDLGKWTAMGMTGHNSRTLKKSCIAPAPGTTFLKIGFARKSSMEGGRKTSYEFQIGSSVTATHKRTTLTSSIPATNGRMAYQEKGLRKKVQGFDHVAVEVGVLESIDTLTKCILGNDVSSQTLPAGKNVDRSPRITQLPDMSEKDVQFLRHQGVQERHFLLRELAHGVLATGCVHVLVTDIDDY